MTDIPVETPSSSTEPHPHRLQRGVLTVPNGIALAAAAMAPVLAVVLNAPAAGPVAGAALPLSFLLAFVACLLVGNTVVQFARRLPSAGSFYTFNSRGLGPAAGFFTGWLFWIGYAVLAPGLFDAFGSFVQDYFVSTFHVNVPWWIFSLAALAIVFGLSVRSIKASVRIDLTLLVIEVIVFLILAVAAIAHGGSGNTPKVFLPSSAPTGVSGVGLGVVFGILSFIGFDAAATLGEETRNPRRNVPLAVAGALGAVGVFYVFVMYALAAGYQLTNPAKFAAFLKDPNPFVTLGHNVTPWLLQPIELAAIVGIFSCFLAIHNTTVRVMFSMGRDHILPPSIGQVHSRWYSPFRAIIAQSVFTVAVGLATGAWLGPGPTGAYGFTGAIGTVAIVIVYLASNVAHIRYFRKIGERKPFVHVVVPVVGVIALAYPLYSVSKPGQAYPYNYVPWVVLAWIVLGAALYAYYRAKSPAKIAALGNFLAEEDLSADEQPESLLAGRTPAVQHPTVAEEVTRHPELHDGDTCLWDPHADGGSHGDGDQTMIEIEGKQVFTELSELVAPAHTALLLIDMQHDFVEPDGYFGSLGIDLTMYDETRPRLAALLDAARRHGVLVVHVQNTALPNRMSDSPAQIRFNLRMHEGARRGGPPLRYTVPGTPGHDFVADLTPLFGEIVVRKYRSSAFWGTNMELLLRSNNIRTVVVGGCTTEGCVESTARDAMFCDYYVVIADDGVGSDDKEQHEASMLLMSHRFDMASSAEIADLWRVADRDGSAGSDSAVRRADKE